ncbi:MAG: hypothetical protein WCC95_12080 [Candidatus Sulfotelmatobacter sp.]|jgi:hypothetical protein
MRLPTALGMCPLILLLSCNSTTTAPVGTVAPRSYHGTASVGDFLTITVNSSAQTITYTDVSNNTSGTVPYTVNSNGTYTLNDPTGNLIGAYEVPNYALLIQAEKTGPDADAPALITAVESGQISLATFEARPYNIMQFRTAAGGVEAGSISVNAQGVGSVSSYWPFGQFNGGNQGNSPFDVGSIDMSQAQLDPTGTFLKVPEPDGPGYAYAFGTADGIFAVDTPNGAILGLTQAATKEFDPSVAGSYTAIYYEKTNATTGQGNVESGTPSLGNASISVSSSGQLTLTDDLGNRMAQGALAAVADVPALYGSAGELANPCYGLFTFQLTTATSQQYVFVSFLGKAMLFSSFTANLAQPGTYNYFYGVGLK